MKGNSKKRKKVGMQCEIEFAKRLSNGKHFYLESIIERWSRWGGCGNKMRGRAVGRKGEGMKEEKNLIYNKVNLPSYGVFDRTNLSLSIGWPWYLEGEGSASVSTEHIPGKGLKRMDGEKGRGMAGKALIVCCSSLQLSSYVYMFVWICWSIFCHLFAINLDMVICFASLFCPLAAILLDIGSIRW